eukprot:gene10338-2752_t
MKQLSKKKNSSTESDQDSKTKTKSEKNLVRLSLGNSKKRNSEPKLDTAKKQKTELTIEQIAFRMVEEEDYVPEKPIPLDAIIKELNEAWEEIIFDVL